MELVKKPCLKVFEFEKSDKTITKGFKIWKNLGQTRSKVPSQKKINVKIWLEVLSKRMNHTTLDETM
jgi:hypothetical protein